jgi:diguanylate cyclase (GGDEF)-like protein
MAWFGSSDSAKPTRQDADLLRAAMLHLLEELSGEVPRAEAHRIDELRARLERFPMPTGLDKEMERLVAVLRTSALGGGSGDFADAANAMVEAMQRVSILDKDLTQEISEYKDSIPLRVRPGDSRVLQAGAVALEQSAEGARFRQRESQDAVISLLDAVGIHIQEANLSTDSLDGQLGQVARKFAAAQDAEALFGLRSELDGLMGQLRSTSGDLRSELFRAQNRVGDLEDTIQQQREELREARLEMTMDGLTNVANRAAFDKAISAAIVSARRTNGLLTLMIFDLDHFKRVNDTFGHPSGDDVLRTVSKVLEDCVRQDDFVARIGGEEFAAILPNSGKREAASIAERIGHAIRRLQFSHKEDHFSVTISVGIASWDRTEPAESLYERADKALYKAKNSGRDRYVVV